MEECDVLIVGAGLAGLQCARLLCQAGVSVVLVDRKTSLRERVHTTGIFVRKTLEDFDLPEDCLGPAIAKVTLYSPKKRSLHLSSPFEEFRVGKMARIYERYLELGRLAGLRWLSSTRYLDHSVSRGCLIVRLDSEGEVRSVRTRFIIGADGAMSRVARGLNLDLNQEWIVGVEDVFTGVPLNGAPQMHCFLDPGLAPGYLAWVVNDGEEVHVGVGGYPAKFDPLVSLRQLRKSIESIVDLRHALHVERRGGRIPVNGVLKNIQNKYGMLVGDAAGAVSPLTAGGLDPCMRLSSLAARVTAEYLAEGDSEILKVYSGNRFRARFTSRLFMRRILSKIQSPQMIELAIAIMRAPIFTPIAWHVFFGRGSFPNVREDQMPARNSLRSRLQTTP
jgi:flavin-dependent dehydrogenase